jgi:aryl-alcohol dehydrogenase-like predicted oxidoreductase
MSSLDHLQENLGALDAPELNAREIARVESMIRGT